VKNSNAGRGHGQEIRAAFQNNLKGRPDARASSSASSRFQSWYPKERTCPLAAHGTKLPAAAVQKCGRFLGYCGPDMLAVLSHPLPAARRLKRVNLLCRRAGRRSREDQHQTPMCIAVVETVLICAGGRDQSSSAGPLPFHSYLSDRVRRRRLLDSAQSIRRTRSPRRTRPGSITSA
jgi:hypothetical protein